ncbi:AraC family transcriptional regulator [Actinacidiphila sp. ITFR-21]|uniref:AraC family transcriptional regulator n=1 Tax=Actinacidiphila sp. ITFR-21 TaxID=3075199 RepID=UPI002889FE92|nr:AraC family transcriptional regulator [Streptomyces sp. ITFR-21]WNI18371.1 AraC family transcriptional regulator [Streptomyces sp. ITFR-21]
MTATTPREQARHWAHPGLPGVDLLRARYIHHTFPRHAHDGYVIAAVTGGVEGITLPGGAVRAGAGSVVLINPESPHSAYAGGDDGWSYRVLYPAPGVVASVAAGTSALRGTPAFTATVLADPATAAMITDVHRAAENDNALAADTFLRLVLARLLTRHGAATARPGPARDGGRSAAASARDLLAARLTAPPSLAELATRTGTSPFALLRSFKNAYGLPPHSWLTGERVRAARRLLASGATPAATAVTVGFTDQSHLNRHFTRIVGVTPGAYQREHRISRTWTDAGIRGRPVADRAEHGGPDDPRPRRRACKNVQDRPAAVP